MYASLTGGLKVLRQLRRLAKKLYWVSPAGVARKFDVQIKVKKYTK